MREIANAISLGRQSIELRLIGLQSQFELHSTELVAPCHKSRRMTVRGEYTHQSSLLSGLTRSCHLFPILNPRNGPFEDKPSSFMETPRGTTYGEVLRIHTKKTNLWSVSLDSQDLLSAATNAKWCKEWPHGRAELGCRWTIAPTVKTIVGK